MTSPVDSAVPTTRLRFVRRVVWGETRRVLQQEWSVVRAARGDDGPYTVALFEWREVPEENE